MTSHVVTAGVAVLVGMVVALLLDHRAGTVVAACSAMAVLAAMAFVTGMSVARRGAGLVAPSVQDRDHADDGRVDADDAEVRQATTDGALASEWVGRIDSVNDLCRTLDATIQAYSADHPDHEASDEVLSQMRRTHDALVYRATHDSLTGLPNRALVLDRVAQALSATARSGRGLVLMFIDTDGFKAVNDRLGHAAGDRVLYEMAARMRSQLRDGDTVGRIGGDEFVVVMPAIDDPADAGRLATQLLASIEEPIELRTGVEHLSASIGIAHVPPGLCQRTSVQGLLADADAAMYEAKQLGGHRWRMAEGVARRPDIAANGDRRRTAAVR